MACGHQQRENQRIRKREARVCVCGREGGQGMCVWKGGREGESENQHENRREGERKRERRGVVGTFLLVLIGDPI
jgi:hypothetical protein